MSNTRYLAAQVIADVLQGKSLADALPARLKNLSREDRAFVQALCFGVCRFYVRLQCYLRQLLDKPLKAKDKMIEALLLVGLYQLADMRVPEHAAVAETVEAAGTLKQRWVKGLVNAILRSYIRRQTELSTMIVNQVDAYYMHPLWWIEKIKRAWPKQWQAILTANNQHPPFVLRVNARHLSRDAYLTQLEQAKIPAHGIPHTKTAVMLEAARSVESVPGFEKGEVSVQDAAAQLATELLQLKKGQRVLDACAAPGGKLLHILESEPAFAEVVAVEKDATRVQGITENLTRVFPDYKQNKTIQLITADAIATNVWWDKKPFDRILLDAPCSASGVIRRHPDIKLLRQLPDITELAQTQARLLRALWPLLQADGLLLYVTCSVFPDENSDVIKAFVQETKAHVVPIKLAMGHACQFGWQILPGENEMDGFYYCLLQKK